MGKLYVKNFVSSCCGVFTVRIEEGSVFKTNVKGKQTKIDKLQMPTLESVQQRKNLLSIN
jgi:hypothetical protein